MESGFISDIDLGTDSDWQPIPHHGSGHFEFFKVRHFGALLFAKRPTAAFRHDLVTTESLKKEFYIGYNLNHPSIVKYVKMEDGVVFEEYVDGVSLRDMIDSGDIRLRSPRFLEQVCRDLLKAVSYLHSKGVIHNDIKPENVMISRIDNQLKLVDLGAATSDMWDATGGFTPAYRAPEQGVSPTNVYTDIYLVGKLMEQLVPIAGVKRLWGNFLKKATSEKVSERFTSDNEALAAVPDVNQTKKIGIVVIVVLGLLSLVIGIILFPRRSAVVSANSDIVVDSVIPVSMDTIVEHIIKKDEHKPIVTERAPSVRDLIDGELEKYVIDKYNNDVFPHCRRYAEMPSSNDKARLELQIQDIMKSVIADAMEYAEKLAVMKYPAEAEYTRMRVTSLLNAKQTEAARIQYPDSENVRHYDDAVTLDSDSL